MPVEIDYSSLPKFRKKVPEKLKQIREPPHSRRKNLRRIALLAVRMPDILDIGVYKK